jgi:hypothetical protein
VKVFLHWVHGLTSDKSVEHGQALAMIRSYDNGRDEPETDACRDACYYEHDADDPEK